MIKGQKLRVFKNKVLRKIFGAKRDKVVKGDWDFWISDLVINSDGTDI